MLPSHETNPPAGTAPTAKKVAKKAAAKKVAKKAAAPPPEPAAEFADYSLEELRALRTELTDYETRVSYWRRLVQARIDLTRGGEQPENLGRFAAALADAPSRGRRIANLDLFPPDTTPPLPQLDALWRQNPAPDQVDDYLAKLSTIETDLSAHRRALFDRIDALHDELIARYRQDPRLALSALP
jgi:hypothetical protein